MREYAPPIPQEARGHRRSPSTRAVGCAAVEVGRECQPQSSRPTFWVLVHRSVLEEADYEQLLLLRPVEPIQHRPSGCSTVA